MTEVERLRVEVAFWHDAHATVDAQRVKAEAKARKATEIVQAVAALDGWYASGDPDRFYCVMDHPACESGDYSDKVVHAPDCPWMKARALLADEEQKGGDTHGQ